MVETNLSSEKGPKIKDVSKETEAIWHHNVEGERRGRKPVRGRHKSYADLYDKRKF